MFKISTIIALKVSMIVSKTTLRLGWNISKFFLKNGFDLTKTTLNKVYNMSNNAIKSVRSDTKLINYLINSKKKINMILEKRIKNNRFKNLAIIAGKIKQCYVDRDKMPICKKKRINISERNLDILNQWFDSNIQNPYLSPKIKKILANKSNLTENQVTRWLQNKRARQSNPKITKRLSNEIKKSLKKSFSLNRYPKDDKIKELSSKTGISVKKIKLWFANERHKSKVNLIY